jgi:hypothetical protein
VTLEGVKVLKWHFAKFKVLKWHETNFPLDYMEALPILTSPQIKSASVDKPLRSR